MQVPTVREIGNLKANLEFTSNDLRDLKPIKGKDREDEQTEISLLKREIAYLEAYSRRENLIVEGITEAATEMNSKILSLSVAYIYGIDFENRASRIYSVPKSTSAF